MRRQKIVGRKKKRKKKTSYSIKTGSLGHYLAWYSLKSTYVFYIHSETAFKRIIITTN